MSLLGGLQLLQIGQDFLAVTLGADLDITFLITPVGSIRNVLRAARVMPLYSMTEPYFERPHGRDRRAA